MRASKLSALFLTTAMAFGMVGQANAATLKVGESAPFAQMEQTLAQNHQVEVARARYVLNANDPKQMRVLCLKFTINAQGNAYILLSDGMDDSKAHIEVVYGKLKNAHAYNPHDIGALPRGVSPQSDLAAKIQTVGEDGGGVMIYGQSVKEMRDGSEKIVGTTTVMANLSETANRAVRNTVGIFLTDKNGVTRLDPVVGGNVQFRGVPNFSAPDQTPAQKP